jgi:hypothetical protein
MTTAASAPPRSRESSRPIAAAWTVGREGDEADQHVHVEERSTSSVAKPSA